MNTNDIPARCRFVWTCLMGMETAPRYVRQTGKWRNVDLIMATGRNSSDVRLRELMRLLPGQIKSETIPGSKCGAKRFWVERPHPVRTAATTTPMLFDY